MPGLRALAALAVLAASPAAAAPPVPATLDESAAIALAETRGALIYAYDRAAWLGTDAMLAALPGARDTVGGWIVDGPASQPTLVFFDRNEADPKAVYVATFKDNRLVSGHAAGEDERSLSTERKRLIAALRTARLKLASEKAEGCSEKPFNSVVLPPEKDGGPVLVYFLTPQRKMNEVVIGKHYRVDVAADGSASLRAFTNGCLSMPTPRPSKNKGEPAALVLTHLLDPTPTELHVFAALGSGFPLMVMTVSNRKVWAVMGSDVEALGPIPE